MRTNEPFHGIVLVGGHVVFHVALLIASIIVIQFPEVTEENKQFLEFINMFRIAHATNIVYKFIDYLLSSPVKFNKFMFTQKTIETISMFMYFLCAMYALWGVSKYDKDDSVLEKDTLLQKERTWIFIEVSGFLLQIFSASFFLCYTQFKGMLGYNLQPDSDRHKSDALCYYITEIHWFNLIFVTAMIHCISIQSNLASVNKTSEPLKFVYSGLMIASRLLQLYFLLPLKDSRR